MSVREQIIQAVTDSLGGVEAGVYLRRLAELNDRDCPAVIVEPGTDTTMNAAGGVVEHSLQITIAAVASGPDAEATADGLMSDILSAVSADETWDGLATDTTLANISEQKIQAGHVRYGLAATITVRYETSRWSM